MSRRTLAGLIALGLLAVMTGVAAFMPLPYVTYSPGPTFDILSTREGEEQVVVDGHKAYYDDGELRLTTIYLDEPEDDISLVRLLAAYFDPDEAVYPKSSVYQPQETNESSDAESAIQMVSSQDAAVAAALRELDYDVPATVKVAGIEESMPASGVLEVGDTLLMAGAIEVKTPDDVRDAVNIMGAGNPLKFLVRRDGKDVFVDVTPVEVDGQARIGISLGEGFDFPFDVKVNIESNIGGPSAGLMFAMAIYDTLTPGSLTDGGKVAGSGEIRADGSVIGIGGVQQKIAGARDSGSELFLVPAENCSSIRGVHPGDMRLAKVATLEEALAAVETWTEDHDAPLPSCEEESQ